MRPLPPDRRALSPALQSTYREFAKATEEMIAFVAERMRYRRQSPHSPSA